MAKSDPSNNVRQAPEDAWHTLSIAEALKRLASADSGLSQQDAVRRSLTYGPNELPAGTGTSAWKLMAGQFQNVLIVILLVGVVLSILMGHGTEAAVIAVIVVFAVALGFVQEFRAERAMDALRQMSAPTANVMRDGSRVTVPARDLVPGDIVFLHTGDRIPADARLVESINLRCDEASLTGESVAVRKDSNPVPEAAALADRRCMVYSGTSVAYGRGRALVTAIGMASEFGRIAGLLETVKESRTPLQDNLDRVGRALARGAIAVVALIVALGLFRGQPLFDMILFGIALAVAVVPEALPAVVTISLAIGVQRMAKRNALVRRLPAVETLGSVAVIASDKTGTLTKDEMTIRSIFVAGDLVNVSGAGYAPEGLFSIGGVDVAPSPALQHLLHAGVLASDALLQRREDWEIQGDPTEGAVVVAAAKAGIQKGQIDQDFPRVDEIPFTSESRRMTTLHTTQSGVVAYAKGAPEAILNSCTHWLSPHGRVLLDAQARDSIAGHGRTMASRALRVLALSERSKATKENAETAMTFVGLVGMIDPPRAEVKAAIRTCRDAGIKVVMITGDHPATAEAIARELGILEDGRVLTGVELDAIDADTFDRDVEEYEVYARVSPAHKLRVISAYQNKGVAIAMTGDGVNDAPALKKADIGIAMGKTGTDVTREAAAMTLLDDNFASIVAAVEEGRGVFGNIKKYLMYLLSSNIGEITLMAGASFFGMPLPLSAVQILYVNLATDGLPALALAVDPPDDDLMRTPPRNPRSGIFSKAVVALMLVGGLWSAIVNLSLFSWARSSGRSIEEAMTMTFVSLVLIQFFKAYNYRSDRRTIFDRPFANKWLNAAISWELALLGLIVYLPFFQSALGTFGLSVVDWGIILGATLTIIPVLECMKWLHRRGSLLPGGAAP